MKIDISSEIERFSNHLILPDNNQMIFSGIFGIGKTYFIKEFFKEKIDKYEFFLLSPINYSISNNDDIIDYIKYDIAFELLGKNVDYEKTDFSKLLTSQFYLNDNFFDTMSLLAKSGGKIGKAFSDIYENLKKIRNNIKEHNSNSQIDEKRELIDFLKDLTARDHSIYEENRITELISGLIKNLKENENENEKEIVLVIDDLDRLDPEHIFRILNVFSCHFDLGNFSENKFGFHKIILVCDIENIRNLFHSKYGLNVDFSGYIDKFYSREIFYFDNKEIVINAIDNILVSIKIKGKNDYQFDLGNTGSITNLNFKEILIDLISNDLLNLRTLLKLYGKEYSFISFYFRTDENDGPAASWHFKIILIFELLISFYGSITSLKTAFEKLAARNPSKLIDNRQLRRYGNLIIFIDHRNHKRGEGDFEYKRPDLNLLIKYKAARYGSFNDESLANIIELKNLGDGTMRFDFPLAPLLNTAFEEFLNLTRVKN